jgi:hypothetical protein
MKYGSFKYGQAKYGTFSIVVRTVTFSAGNSGILTAKTVSGSRQAKLSALPAAVTAVRAGAGSRSAVMSEAPVCFAVDKVTGGSRSVDCGLDIGIEMTAAGQILRQIIFYINSAACGVTKELPPIHVEMGLSERDPAILTAERAAILTAAERSPAVSAAERSLSISGNERNVIFTVEERKPTIGVTE